MRTQETSVRRTTKAPGFRSGFCHSVGGVAHLRRTPFVLHPTFTKSEAFIKNEIASHDAVIFSKTYCPFCTKTKDLFRDIGSGSDVAVVELDKMADGGAIQDALLSMTGQRTVPNVFVKGQHIGGNDDSQKAAREGKLQAMLGGSVAMMSISGGVLHVRRLRVGVRVSPSLQVQVTQDVGQNRGGLWGRGGLGATQQQIASFHVCPQFRPEPRCRP